MISAMHWQETMSELNDVSMQEFRYSNPTERVIKTIRLSVKTWQSPVDTSQENRGKLSYYVHADIEFASHL